MIKFNFKLKNINLLWVFPLMALGFSLWFGYRFFAEKGQEITVLFADAKSIQAEKTKVFYRGVPVGVVKEITLSKDGTKAVCRIALQKNAAQFAREGTGFYLVSPKVGFEGISGLETLISGSYIALEPGRGKKEKFKFIGEMSKPSIEPEENTLAYVLETEDAESVSSGDNIFFRGIVIGAVGEVKLSKSGQKVVININVRNIYKRLIRTNTVFWKKQGIKADLGLFGSKIKINSLDTILKGGIEISTPNEVGPIASEKTKFTLQDDEPKDKPKWSPVLTPHNPVEKVKK